jgi:hypothetical protein
MLTTPLDCMQVCLTGFGAHVGQLLALWIPLWTVWTGRLLLPTEELLSHGFELVRLYSYLFPTGMHVLTTAPSSSPQVRLYSYLFLLLVLLLLGLRSCLPSFIRVWLEDPADGLVSLWNDPVQLAAAASPTWEALRWMAALLNVCWVGLSLSAFHCHDAQDGALFHGRGGGVRRVPAVVLVVLSSGLLVCMLAMLARMGDEGAVSGAEAEGAVSGAEGEGEDEGAGGSSIWAASVTTSDETSPDGISTRELSASHGPSLPSGGAPLPPYHSLPSGGAPLPPYHSAHRAVLLAALPAGIACAITLAPRVWPALNTALDPSAWLRGWRGGRGAVLGGRAAAAAVEEAVGDAQDGARAAPPVLPDRHRDEEELFAEAQRELDGVADELQQRGEQLIRLLNEQSLRHDALHTAFTLRVFAEAHRAYFNR